MRRSDSLRLKKYLKLSSEFARIKDRDLLVLLKKNEIRSGWGSNHAFTLAGERVFAKKIPLTRLEQAKAFDTSNLFDLPLYYNYGVGSAGFGAYRELVTHINTTNWVLDGKHASFPLLYHYRIVPRTAKPGALDLAKHRAYVKRWNDSRAIDRYIRERRQSEFEIVLILEHFPETLARWLPTHTQRAQAISDEVGETLEFLRSQGILHFDAHLQNIVTDGRRFVLSDFGLALDRRFHLSAPERAFFRRHSHYDFVEFVGCMGFELESAYRKLLPAKRAVVDGLVGAFDPDDWRGRQAAFLENLDRLKAKRVFGVAPSYYRYLEKNRRVILLSNDFFYRLGRNPRKDTKFDDELAKRLLAR